MNPFEKWRIRSLSPAQLNRSPAIWLLTRFTDVDDAGSVKAWRGKAVEAGLCAHFDGASLEAAQSVALDTFDEQSWGIIEEGTEQEREAIAAYLGQAASYFAEMPKPVARQEMVSVDFDGIEVPIVGTLDFRFDEPEPFVLDLKTTKAIPSVPRPHDVRQVALYATGKGTHGAVLYVSAKRALLHVLTRAQIDEGIADLRCRARVRRKLLMMSSSPETLATLIEPDFSDFRWTIELRAKARELWGV